MTSYLRQKPILTIPILLIIVLLFFYLKNSREKALEDRAVRYCTDIAISSMRMIILIYL